MLEIKIFKNKVSAYDLIHFMRDLRVVSRGDGSYINISRDQAANEKVKAVTGLANLDALFLSEKEVENFFQNCMLLNTWVLGFEENVGSQVSNVNGEYGNWFNFFVKAIPAISDKALTVERCS